MVHLMRKFSRKGRLVSSDVRGWELPLMLVFLRWTQKDGIQTWDSEPWGGDAGPSVLGARSLDGGPLCLELRALGGGTGVAAAGVSLRGAGWSWLCKCCKNYNEDPAASMGGTVTTSVRNQCWRDAHRKCKLGRGSGESPFLLQLCSFHLVLPIGRAYWVSAWKAKMRFAASQPQHHREQEGFASWDNSLVTDIALHKPIILRILKL